MIEAFSVKLISFIHSFIHSFIDFSLPKSSGLDSKLIFNRHITQKINTCDRLIGLIKILSLILLLRKQLLTIYKTFVRSYLDYADSFKEKLEKV